MDFNGDEHLDLAVGCFSTASVDILYGDGAGNFSPYQSFAAGVEPYAVVVADFNEDGQPDLAVLDNGGNQVSVLLNSAGAGMQHSFGIAASVGTGMAPYSVAVGDFNLDGKPDLVTANYSSNDISVSLNASQ
jgi:hypothetical protein